MFAVMKGLNDEADVDKDIEKAAFMTQLARQPAVHQKADAATGSSAVNANTVDASIGRDRRLLRCNEQSERHACLSRFHSSSTSPGHYSTAL
jgi:hypothetical protein